MAPRRRRKAAIEVEDKVVPRSPTPLRPFVSTRVRPRPSPKDMISPLEPISPWPPIPPTPTPTPPPCANALQSDLLGHSSKSACRGDGADRGAAGLGRAKTAGEEDDMLPSAKEVYGSLAVLSTTLAFGTYLVWAFLPGEYLDSIGWTWYPAREWAVVVPCFLMVVVLLAYFSYAALTAFLTPSFDSQTLISDTRSGGIPEFKAGEDRYYWHLDGPMPPAVDIPIDVVNRVMYPPQRRPKPSASTPASEPSSN